MDGWYCLGKDHTKVAIIIVYLDAHKHIQICLNNLIKKQSFEVDFEEDWAYGLRGYTFLLYYPGDALHMIVPHTCNHPILYVIDSFKNFDIFSTYT